MNIGLALSGGGARAAAHLGIIKFFEESGVEFDIISGTSAGALVGALYAQGLTVAEIISALGKTNFLTLFRPALNRSGLLKIENGYSVLKKYLTEDNFDALKIPMIVAASDLKNGKIKYFKKGPLIRPILASCSVPIVFNPVKIKDKMYIDGGFLDNLPVKPLLKKCKFIVGLNCNPVGPDFHASGWRNIIERSMLLSIDPKTKMSSKLCDIFLEPAGLSGYNVFDFKKLNEIFDIGYKYAVTQRDQIEHWINREVNA